MSGDWIKMRGNLWDDPRIGRICDLAGVKEATAIGALYWLWATADQHTSDGCMPGLSTQQIDRKTGVKGFAAALVDVGWLTDDPQGVVICHFEEHNGASAKKRAQTAKRVANSRSGNADETQNLESGNAQSVTPALAREEKEKEKKKNTPKAPKGADADPPGFAEFWAAWPNTDRKQDRKKCAAKWARGDFGHELAAILAHIAALKQSAKWRDGFDPAPLTYLNGERWLDGAPVNGLLPEFADVR